MAGRDRYIVFYRSLPQECGYLPGRQATNAVMDPMVVPDRTLYSRLVDLGFRRSGARIYRPACGACNACLALRIPVASFRPSRIQRRVWRQHAGLSVTERDPVFRQEHYELIDAIICIRQWHGSNMIICPSWYVRASIPLLGSRACRRGGGR